MVEKLTMDKFALVYEFNKESPLLVYKASKEIEDRNITNAIELLNTSIEKYPYYPTAYFLLSVALAYKGDYTKANEIITKGNNLLDEEQTSQYYSNLIGKIKKEAEGLDTNFEDTVSKVLDDSFNDENDFYDFDDISIENDNNEVKQTESPKGNITEGTIVTETLAEIYNTQGNYKEALDIYNRLLKIQPEKTAKFNQKILEISNSMGSKK
ncbi:MAG: hypothetical protein GY936_00175 [Ignavibacteriae bacterium]|nr:hypothetical protein [Ignavibacteriota bacterium]